MGSSWILSAASEPGASLETAVALQDGAVPPDALAGRTVRERREDALDRRGQLGGAEAEQGGEPSHRVAAPVEAEHELVEIVVEMIRPDAMMRAVDVPP